MLFSVLCLLCLCACLFICALLSPAGKGLTSWPSYVVSYSEFIIFTYSQGRSGLPCDFDADLW